MRYTVPSLIHPDRMREEQIIRFRVGSVYKNCYLGVYLNGERILHRKCPVMAPGEMEEVKIKKSQLTGLSGPAELSIQVEEA